MQRTPTEPYPLSPARKKKKVTPPESEVPAGRPVDRIVESVVNSRNTTFGTKYLVLASPILTYLTNWLQLVFCHPLQQLRPAITVSFEGEHPAAPSEVAAGGSKSKALPASKAADGKVEKKKHVRDTTTQDVEPHQKALRRSTHMKDDEAAGNSKTTAVKAKAKPAAASACEKTKEEPKSADKVVPKIERAKSEVGQTVAACLNRKDTAEMTPKGNTTKGPGPSKDAKEDKTAESESESEAEDQDMEEAAEKVKKQKKAHARYMRFSRSLKRTLALILCVCWLGNTGRNKL